MSKGNMLLGHARGKVGDLVFSRSNGQQVVRSRAAVVKNPQTESQMIQRIILNTVSQAYSRMRPITDHSFEGVQPGQKTMSAFMKKNLDILRTIVSNNIAAGFDLDSIWAFTPVGQNNYATNAYVVSQGSLPAVEYSVGALNLGLMPLKANTYEGVINQYGLKRGDQLTFIGIHVMSAGSVTFHYARVILDPVDAAGNQLPLSTAFIGADNAIVNPNPRNEGEFNTLAFADSQVSYKFAEGRLGSTAIIVSRKDNAGNWQRSNAALVYRDTDVAGFEPSLYDALETSKLGGFDTLNDRYLNNAGTGVLAGANGDTIDVKDGDDSVVSLVGLKQGTGTNAGFIVGVDVDGDEYLIRNGSAISQSYNKCLSAMTGYVATAWTQMPEGTSNDKFVLVEALNSSFGEWLLNNGVSYSVFISGEM